MVVDVAEDDTEFLRAFYCGEAGDAGEDAPGRAGVPQGHVPLVAGDGRADAGRAEGAALVWGMAWALQHSGSGELPGVPVTFRFDAKPYGEAAADKGASWTDTALRQQLFGLGALVRERLYAKWEHVSGHAGIPGNELADAGAKAARAGLLPLSGPPGSAVRRFLASKQAWNWGWFHLAAVDPARGLPPVVNGWIVAPQPRVEATLPVWPSACLLYTSPSPRDKRQSRMPSSA